jgi:hypothetical protein
LKKALDGLRKDLRDPAVHSDFNISIVEGPKRQDGATGFSRAPGAITSSRLLFGVCGFILCGFIRRSRSRYARGSPRTLPFGPGVLGPEPLRMVTRFCSSLSSASLSRCDAGGSGTGDPIEAGRASAAARSS